MAQVANADPMARPPADPSRTARTRLPLAATLALAFLVPAVGGAAIVGGWAWHRFGSVSAAVAFLRGESLWIEPSHVDLGSVAPDERRTPTLRVTNLSRRPITLHGMRGFCDEAGCLGPAEEEFPIDLASWDTRELALRVVATSRPEAPIRLETSLYTSIGDRTLIVSGEVRDAGLSSPRP